MHKMLNGLQSKILLRRAQMGRTLMFSQNNMEGVFKVCFVSDLKMDRPDWVLWLRPAEHVTTQRSVKHSDWET